MKIRSQIESSFDGKAFDLPLFYCYEGGLRFELSEGGHYINQFLSAHRKALEICEQVFEKDSLITVCFKFFGGKSLFSSLSTLKTLKTAGIYPEGQKEHWTEFDACWKDDEDYVDCRWHYLAFQISSEFLMNLLWSAFSSDFGYIEPNPGVMVYLFNFEKQVLLFPYDDRGMDVVGPNKNFLYELYCKFNTYLLEYDREAMDQTFLNYKA